MRLWCQSVGQRLHTGSDKCGKAKTELHKGSDLSGKSTRLFSLSTAQLKLRVCLHSLPSQTSLNDQVPTTGTTHHKVYVDGELVEDLKGTTTHNVPIGPIKLERLGRKVCCVCVFDRCAVSLRVC